MPFEHCALPADSTSHQDSHVSRRYKNSENERSIRHVLVSSHWDVAKRLVFQPKECGSKRAKSWHTLNQRTMHNPGYIKVLGYIGYAVESC